MTAGPGRKLRLVHITTVPMTLNFFRGQIGYLTSHGFEVHAVSSPGDEQALRQFGADERVVVHAVPMTRRMSPFSDLPSLFRLWRVFRRLRPDIVHCHSPKAGLLGTLAARAAGVPVVFLSIFGLVQMTRTGISRRLLDATTRLACRLADRVWCDSFSMRDYMAREGLCNESRLFVVGNGSVNGIDAAGAFFPESNSPASAEMRSDFGIPLDTLVIGFVGRLTGDKGMHELATAWRVLREQRPDLHLLLVGPLEAQDPMQPEDESLFRQDDRVHIAGPQRNVAPFLAAMDIFVMPSYREGFGVANLEAAAMSLPVVATRIPGCVDSVRDGVTGTLVPVRQADALREAIERYVEDESLRAAHGRAGRARVLTDFRPEDIWASLRSEYERVASAKVRTLVSRPDACVNAIDRKLSMCRRSLTLGSGTARLRGGERLPHRHPPTSQPWDKEADTSSRPGP